MSIEVGTDRISSSQQRLLETVQGQGLDHDDIAHIFRRLLGDEEIISGEEQLHPEWQRLYSIHRQRISSEVSREHLQSMDEIFGHEFDSTVDLIDPNDAKICFLLGAGASKPHPSGIPTVKELLPDMLERARRLDREEVTKLADFCKRTAINNIEDLLTAAHISKFCGRNPTIMKLVDFLLFSEEPTEMKRRGNVYYDRYGRRVKKQRVDTSSIVLLQDTLQLLFGLLSSQMLPAKPNDGHKAIADYVKEHSDASIITTNYDCCIDLAMIETGISCSYGLDFTKEPDAGSSKLVDSPISIVKLHGSLNWFYCDTCQTVHSVDIKQTVSDYLGDKAMYPVIGVCKDCGGQRKGLLVPPLAMKFDAAPPLHNLIKKATDIFSDSNINIIVVIGFSFSDADLYISRMITKAIQKNNSVKVVLFDTDREVVEKVRRKFSVRVPDFDDSRILGVYGDCSTTLPKFLNGNYLEKKENQKEIPSIVSYIGDTSI